jgi:hypothetical protein
LKSLNKLKEDIYKREMARIKELHKQRLEAKVAEQTNPNRFYNLAEESDSDGSISSCCSPKPTKPVSRFANITLRKHQEDWHYDEYDDYDVVSELTDSDDDDDDDDESSEIDDAVDAKRQQMLDDEELIEQYFDDGDCHRNR